MFVGTKIFLNLEDKMAVKKKKTKTAAKKRKVVKKKTVKKKSSAKKPVCKSYSKRMKSCECGEMGTGGR
jgi:hypothetical protein